MAEPARNRGEHYRNEDGAATDSAQLAFDREWQIYVFVLLLCGASGLAVNISAAMLLHI